MTIVLTTWIWHKSSPLYNLYFVYNLSFYMIANNYFVQRYYFIAIYQNDTLPFGVEL